MKDAADQDHDVKEFMETENSRNHPGLFDGVNNGADRKGNAARHQENRLGRGHIGQHLLEGEERRPSHEQIDDGIQFSGRPREKNL